jgi:hypothetical protein
MMLLVAEPRIKESLEKPEISETGRIGPEWLVCARIGVAERL